MLYRTVQFSKSAASPSDKAARPSPGRPKDAGKRDSILRAATSFFMNEGYQRTSLDAVARKANVSKLTIYSHFADKDDLFRQVIRHRCDQLLGEHDFVELGQKPVKTALLQLADKFIKHIFAPESIRMHRIMQAEALHHPQVVQMFYEAGPLRVRAAMADLLRGWCRRKELTIADIPTAVEQFFSLLKGELMMRLILRRGAAPDAATLRRHVRATVAMFLAAYRP